MNIPSSDTGDSQIHRCSQGSACTLRGHAWGYHFPCRWWGFTDNPTNPTNAVRENPAFLCAFWCAFFLIYFDDPRCIARYCKHNINCAVSASAKNIFPWCSMMFHGHGMNCEAFLFGTWWSRWYSAMRFRQVWMFTPVCLKWDFGGLNRQYDRELTRKGDDAFWG